MAAVTIVEISSSTIEISIHPGLSLVGRDFAGQYAIKIAEAYSLGARWRVAGQARRNAEELTIKLIKVDS